jgi:hypothetical protein
MFLHLLLSIVPLIVDDSDGNACVIDYMYDRILLLFQLREFRIENFQ